MSDLDTKDEEKENAVVPYFVHEGELARMERIIRILATLLVAALALFIVNNVVWMKYTKRQTETEAHIEETSDPGLFEQSDPGTGE